MSAALFAPWRTSSTFRALGHLVLDLPVGAAMFALTFPVAAVMVSTIVLFPLSLAASVVLFLVAHGLARVERSRFEALLGIRFIDQSAPLDGTSRWRRHRQRLTSAARWKEIA